MTEATLSQWYAADGAQVAAGEPPYVLEMDKSTNDIDAPVTGKLRIIGEYGRGLFGRGVDRDHRFCLNPVVHPPALPAAKEHPHGSSAIIGSARVIASTPFDQFQLSQYPLGRWQLYSAR